MYTLSRVVMLAGLVSTAGLTFGATAQAQDKAAKKREAPDGTVRFEAGSTRITEASKVGLDRIAEYIAGHPAGDILVVGHADRQGGRLTNLRLSKRRAHTVKQELGKRSVPGSRITVMGVGSSEPLSTEKGTAADNLNRRVEVWVGTREAIAWVSYIYRSVQSQKPAAQQWDPAEIRMRLRRLFRIRTMGRSAGEVTFSEGRTLFLGPETLVVIYGKDARKKRGTRAVADVTVEQGSLLASLGPDPVLVDTQDARFKLSSQRTRFDANPKKRRTTVSVYDGTAEVSAQRKTVKVPQGYGTRVRNGQAPEAATALPLPPRWTDSRSMVGFAGRPVTVSWLRADPHPGAFVEVGGIEDRALTQPFEMRSVEDSQVVFRNLAPGAYLVRVSSVDAREIIGVAGQPRTLIILPSPEAVDGTLSWNGVRWMLSKSGQVRLPSAGKITTTWMSDLRPDTPMPETFVAQPGPTNLKVQLSDAAGRILGEGRTQVFVRPVALAAPAQTGGTLTGTTAWNTPPAAAPPGPTATPLPPLAARGMAVETAFRMQAGYSGGLLIESGPSFALTAAAIRGRLRAEVGGRYHVPRTTPIRTLAPGSSARLSLFELDIRGCFMIDSGRFQLPLCAGVSSGRWKADPLGLVPADPTAATWVGGHILFSGRYEVDSNLAFWAGAQGTMSIVQPQLRLNVAPGSALLQAGRYASALEAGVEVKFN